MAQKTSNKDQSDSSEKKTEMFIDSFLELLFRQIEEANQNIIDERQSKHSNT